MAVAVVVPVMTMMPMVAIVTMMAVVTPDAHVDWRRRIRLDVNHATRRHGIHVDDPRRLRNDHRADRGRARHDGHRLNGFVPIFHSPRPAVDDGADHRARRSSDHGPFRPTISVMPSNQRAGDRADDGRVAHDGRPVNFRLRRADRTRRQRQGKKQRFHAVMRRRSPKKVYAKFFSSIAVSPGTSTSRFNRQRFEETALNAFSRKTSRRSPACRGSAPTPPRPGRRTAWPQATTPRWQRCNRERTARSTSRPPPPDSRARP